MMVIVMVLINMIILMIVLIYIHIYIHSPFSDPPIWGVSMLSRRLKDALTFV